MAKHIISIQRKFIRGGDENYGISEVGMYGGIKDLGGLGFETKNSKI